LLAWYLLVEDPQRRLEVQPISTLAHQASVVHHITQQPALRRVLLADEVGLGKTVEAGLLIKQLLTQKPSARILYLAPARLVRSVRTELNKLGLMFRSWVASAERDARLDDNRVVASIHRAALEERQKEILAAPAWDMIVVDECHHLSDWAPGGGKPVAQYRLVEKLAERLGDEGRLLLMSGTPHQGHADRFKNLLKLLQRKSEPEEVLAGRVIYRTKEDVRDWDGQPLFPGRQVNSPVVVDLGDAHVEWLGRIHDFFEPDRARSGDRSAQRRAAGWRAGQALQWASSSIQAGLGYLVRQAVRAELTPKKLPILTKAVAALRPYRMGDVDEPVEPLYQRIAKEVGRQLTDDDDEDIEEIVPDDGKWRPDPQSLAALLEEGIEILEEVADKKWDLLWERLLVPAGEEKVVLFAQPIETVTAVADYIQRKTGRRPALIIGNQNETAREEEVQRFWDPKGPQFLVSSRAGGEGINLQVARRLVHLDVPWNPMDLEQRIGRVHRFKSRRTILVDTLVVKDSREVDTYAYAREKLMTIASTLVPADRFDALFSRVMALVPPEELQDVLVQSPIGPLTDDDKRKLAELVTRGFDQWRGFHERYSSQQQQIQALDAGHATWDDLAEFVLQHMDGKAAEGFSSLKFMFEKGEVVESAQTARVINIKGKSYACGDYGGMPVTRDDGASADRLGTNVPVVASVLRSVAFPGDAVGAAHLRWPEGEPRPMEGTFGVLALARQAVRWEGSYAEGATTLHVFLVRSDGQVTEVAPEARGRTVRTLAKAVVRREPATEPALVEALQQAELSCMRTLKRPADDDRETKFGVTPLFAAIVE
jgi:superfamily II DNA or RNA helicase